MSIQRITAGGGVLFKKGDDHTSVLLIYRRGVWDLPKGKKELEETAEQCALREVAEEVGCALPATLGKLTETYHEYREGGDKIGKTTHWYVMKTDTQRDFEPEQQEGIEEVRWFDLKEAKRIVGYENLVSVLHAFENWLQVQNKKA